MKKGHESATGGQHNLTTRCCDVKYLGLWSSRLTWLGVSSSFTLFAGRNRCACSCFPKFSLHIMAMVSAIFWGGAPRRKNEVYQTCACGISQCVWQSLFPPIARETAHTDFCQTASWAKTRSNKLFEKSASMPQTGGPLAMNSWQWFNTRTSAAAGKKQHVTQRLIIGLTFLYRLRMVQTAMIVMRHVKGFAVHCYSYPMTRQSVCRNIHKFHQIPALNQNGKQRVGNFNACISERILRQDFWQHSQPSSHGLGHEICVSCPKNSQKFTKIQ